ncbi:MAG: family 16 glycoside hydrolase [Planctomycetaceae bacterium]
MLMYSVSRGFGVRILSLAVAGSFTCVLALAGCGGSPTPPPTPPQRLPEKILTDDNSGQPPRPRFVTGRCRIDTTAPGWSVFVDGYPARTTDGAILTTPCVVESTAISHSVTVARHGFLDQSRQVLFGNGAEVDFDTSAVPAGDSLLLNAPYLSFAVGTAVPLESLNSTGREFDPFLSRDGRGILFAADRPEGRGIYMASRVSPLHPFDAPTLLRLTSSVDQAASPSINGAETMIVYSLPSKGRLRGLTRASPLAEFEDPVVLLTDEDQNARFPSAQIVASGDRIYFTREIEGITETRVAFPTPDMNLPFGNVRIVQFLGEHPRLSADGLRQYLFDGETVRRARRTAINLPFDGSEPIARVKLPEYRASLGHRQFCLSDDEQWLFYSDDPVGAGDLWMARISDGPGWGVPPVGTSAEPRPIVATAPQMRPGDADFVPPSEQPEPEPPRDPRSLPLPYATFRQQFLELTGRLRFREALDQIEAAQARPELADATQLLAWDHQDVQQLLQFWSDIERGAQQFQPGTRLSFGALTVEFETYANGVLTVRARTKSFEKPLIELDAATLLSLADPVLDPMDTVAMLRAAIFLTYSGDGSSSRRQRFLTEAGPLSLEFLNHLAERDAALARMELNRENVSAALQQIEALQREFPDSPAARRAEQLRAELYTRVPWQTVGRRNWTTGPDGEWAADNNRVDGALLQSPHELSNFSLTMEYKTTDATGQGGVYFTYSGRGRLDRNALKVQLSQDAGVRPDPYCTGALFNVEAPTVNAAKKLGEWNSFQMSVHGDRLTVRINGQQVLKTRFDANGRTPGYVALDGVSGGITYRKVILSDQPVAP